MTALSTPMGGKPRLYKTCLGAAIGRVAPLASVFLSRREDFEALILSMHSRRRLSVMSETGTERED